MTQRKPETSAPPVQLGIDGDFTDQEGRDERLAPLFYLLDNKPGILVDVLGLAIKNGPTVAWLREASVALAAAAQALSHSDTHAITLDERTAAVAREKLAIHSRNGVEYDSSVIQLAAIAGEAAVRGIVFDESVLPHFDPDVSPAMPLAA